MMMMMSHMTRAVRSRSCGADCSPQAAASTAKESAAVPRAAVQRAQGGSLANSVAGERQDCCPRDCLLLRMAAGARPEAGWWTCEWREDEPMLTSPAAGATSRLV